MLSANTKLGLLIGVSVLSLVVFISFLYLICKWYLGRKKVAERDKRGRFEMIKHPNMLDDEPKHSFGVEKQYLFREGSCRSVDSMRSTGESPPPMYDEDMKKLRVGKFEFTPSYYHHKRRLEVVIRRLTCYPLYQANAYLYVVAFLLPDRSDYFESELQQISEDNLIDEMCEFVVAYDDLEKRTLRFEIHVCDRYTRHRLIDEKSYLLKKRKSDETIDGCEKIEFEECIEVDDKTLSRNVETQLGSEILFSLCYMPTSGRLTFVALKGKNLLIKDEKTIGVFLRVAHIQGSRLTKTVQTNTSKKTLNPVYNEAFVFVVPLDKTREANIVIKVYAARKGDEEDLIGKVVIGTNAGSNLGRKHWEAMLFTSRKPVAQWHPISI